MDSLQHKRSILNMANRLNEARKWHRVGWFVLGQEPGIPMPENKMPISIRLDGTSILTASILIGQYRAKLQGKRPDSGDMIFRNLSDFERMVAHLQGLDKEKRHEEANNPTRMPE